jgi:hypothetical protein
MSNRSEPHPLWQLLPILVSGGAAALVGYQLGRAAKRSAALRVALSAPADTTVNESPDLRNAGLTYRPIGGPGTPYPDWLRALKGKSGVYVIREIQRDGSSVAAYVGSSRAGRLYQTVTRHFQAWRRGTKANKYWIGQFTRHQSHDPGLTYRRDRVTVATRVLSDERAVVEEARLIARLQPRDNLVMQPAGDIDLEEVIPF